MVCHGLPLSAIVCLGCCWLGPAASPCIPIASPCIPTASTCTPLPLLLFVLSVLSVFICFLKFPLFPVFFKGCVPARRMDTYLFKALKLIQFCWHCTSPECFVDFVARLHLSAGKAVEHESHVSVVHLTWKTSRAYQAQLQKVFLPPGACFLRQNFPNIEEEFS